MNKPGMASHLGTKSLSRFLTTEHTEHTEHTETNPRAGVPRWPPAALPDSMSDALLPSQWHSTLACESLSTHHCRSSR